MSDEAPTPTLSLSESLVAVLKDTAHPLTMKDLVKKLPKAPKAPKGHKAPSVQEQIESLWPELTATAGASVYPSGKTGELRYWMKDEKEIVREQAVERADKPVALAALAKALAKELKGGEEFVTAVLNDLLGAGVLHTHPPTTKGPLVGAHPAPPVVPLGDSLVAVLKDAPHPLKAAELAKQLPPAPGRPTGKRLVEQVEAELPEEVRIGRAFVCPSGKKGEPRYWGREERTVLREAALAAAEVPKALSALKSAVGKAIKGVDGEFVESELRRMIGDGSLHPHPSGKKGGTETFGRAPYVAPPPLPPLERKPHHKDFDKLVESCRKLARKAEVSTEELLDALRLRLSVTQPESGKAPEVEAVAPTPSSADHPPSRPDELIVQALRGTPVVSLRDLRSQMPTEHQGATFDEAVLRLDAQQRVVLFSDVNPDAFDDATRSQFVKGTGTLFTTISLRD